MTPEDAARAAREGLRVQYRPTGERGWVTRGFDDGRLAVLFDGHTDDDSTWVCAPIDLELVFPGDAAGRGRDTLRAQLTAVDADLQAGIAAVIDRWHMDWTGRAGPPPSPHQMVDQTGRPVLLDALTARAQVLAALAHLER